MTCRLHYNFVRVTLCLSACSCHSQPHTLGLPYTLYYNRNVELRVIWEKNGNSVAVKLRVRWMRRLSCTFFSTDDQKAVAVTNGDANFKNLLGTVSKIKFKRARISLSKSENTMKIFLNKKIKKADKKIFRVHDQREVHRSRARKSRVNTKRDHFDRASSRNFPSNVQANILIREV